MKYLLLMTLLMALCVPAAAGTLFIDRESRQFTLIDDDGDRILFGPISSARPGKITPPGIFQVQSKDMDGYSYKYDAPMRWMVAFNGDITIHEGEVPRDGSNISEGCVHVNHYFAKEIFRWMNVGDKVYVK